MVISAFARAVQSKSSVCIVTYRPSLSCFLIVKAPFAVISVAVSKLSLFFHHLFEVWTAEPGTYLVPDTRDQRCLQRTCDPFIQRCLFIHPVITQPSLTGLTQP